MCKKEISACPLEKYIIEAFAFQSLFVAFVVGKNALFAAIFVGHGPFTEILGQKQVFGLWLCHTRPESRKMSRNYKLQSQNIDIKTTSFFQAGD